MMTQRCVRSPQKPRLHYSPNPLIVWVQKVEIPLSLSLSFLLDDLLFFYCLDTL